MSKWDKLTAKICNLSSNVRFDEIKKILESYGYTMYMPGGGSSHCTFRKEGCIQLQYPDMNQLKKYTYSW